MCDYNNWDQATCEVFHNFENSTRKHRFGKSTSELGENEINYYLYTSLFPNNDHINYLKKRIKDPEKAIEEFRNLLNINPSERDMLDFFKKYDYMYAAILMDYPFGHHDIFIFREFMLSSEYQADALIIGKNSDGYHFIFIELESPSEKTNEKVFNSDGNIGSIITKGYNQIKDWKRFLNNNYSQIKIRLTNYLNKNCKNKNCIYFDNCYKKKYIDPNLPNEFSVYDPTRIHYLIVAGKRNHFDRHKDSRNNIRDFVKGKENLEIINYNRILYNLEVYFNC